MTPTSIVIACDQCGRVDVPAVTDPEAVGLAINRMHVHGAAGPLAERSWVVTHLTSGVVMGAGYVEQAQAEYALRLLGSVPVDWRLPYQDPALHTPELRAAMNAIIAEARGLHVREAP